MWVAVLNTNNINRKYYGFFETIDGAWDWINKEDPHRQDTWYLLKIENKESRNND